MAWACSGSTNAELIDNLFKNGLITDPKVRDAMVNVDRAKFCPDHTHAYQDSPQSIGHLATISAPHMHASACEALLPYLKPGNTVLDVGSGSGYLTAVLAELVVAPEGQLPGGTGKVIGLEHIAALRDLGHGNMVKSRRGKELLASGKVKFVVGDGRKGYVTEEIYGGRDEELWDAIHVGAAAVEVHEELIKQLKRPGRMFIPVENGEGGDQWIWLIDKDENGDIKRTRREAVRYVLLTDAPK